MGANASLQDRPISGNQSTLNSSRSLQLYSDYDTVAMREKKKKASKFATLRKKLGRSRRHSRNYDYGKALRELTSTWTTRELHSLCDEYDALMALKDLTFLANVARPSASTILEDLAALYEHKYCTDVDLVYEGTIFPAHRAILCIRCALFRELLSKYPEYGAKVPVVIQTPGVDVVLFSALLRFLYTGDFGLEPGHLHCLKKLLNSLASEFGAPNSIDQDLRTLLDTGAYSDAFLLFTSDPIINQMHDGSLPRRESASEGGGALFSEIRCHWAILAARSPFFRSLFFRRARSRVEVGGRVRECMTQIVLDDEIIPRRFARVLLNAIYLDIVDMTFILPTNLCPPSSSDYQVFPPQNRPSPMPFEEAMDLYHIGQFLDFPALSQSCEDIIAESLSLENFLSVLKWSSKSHGSKWVHRQALHFLREEFLQIAHSPVLLDMTKECLVEALSSDFLQASELDILVAVIKWGEHQLVKRIEEREPNLLSQTAHSISKKGIKKRDLNDVELREILAYLLPLIRVDHIIPTNCEVLVNSIKRGLVSSPPSHMIGPDTGHSAASAWVRTRNAALFVKPRLFAPYCEEAKLIIKEMNSRAPEPSSVIPVQYAHTCAIPDALYMLDEQSYLPQLTRQWSFSSSTIDIVAGTIPVPDKEVLQEMRRRESDLSRNKLAQRAYSLLSSDRLAVTREIQLRVVREFGFPDSAIEVLQGSLDHVTHRQDMCLPQSGACCLLPHQSRLLFQFRSRAVHRGVYMEERQSPSMSPSIARSCIHAESSRESRNDSPVRLAMPDVAIATASVGHLSVQEEDASAGSSPQPPADFDLDLGDGASHAPSTSR